MEGVWIGKVRSLQKSWMKIYELPLLRKRFVECCIEFALLRMYIGYKSVST